MSLQSVKDYFRENSLPLEVSETEKETGTVAVSYTHLTLPTILRV